MFVGITIKKNPWSLKFQLLQRTLAPSESYQLRENRGRVPKSRQKCVADLKVREAVSSLGWKSALYL